MDRQAQDDNARETESVASGLTSLENGADDFDRLMIQNARDERRLQGALLGKVQPFRKARSHPRVGLTLENLERNDAAIDANVNAHVQFKGPPSSNGSAHSDPAIQPPAGWGRKGRVRRDWLRTITSDEEPTPGAQEDQDEDGADMVRPSIEDSPLSHKSSLQGTPVSTRHHDRMYDWDVSLDLNDASMIASTPYIPRNTVLEDIRQRELESLKEQAVTTARLDRIRGSSPEETRRPPSSSSKSTGKLTNGVSVSEQTHATGPSEMRLHKRTNSWQSIGKSQTVAREGSENSPIVVYKKSLETIGVVDRGVLANAQTSSTRPAKRREDSHDLLRRLARASSNTPSPKNTNSRPHTAPASQPGSSSQAAMAGSSPSPPGAGKPASTHESRQDGPQRPSEPVKEPPPDVDATPMPVERSVLNPKTPVVTGAWIDTPGPRTIRKPEEERRPRSQSPQKGSPRKTSPTKQPSIPPEEAPEMAAPSGRIRPTLPSSALQAIVEEARANRESRPDGFGDSTINSLEELITPLRESADAGELDEDTLQGLQLPSGPPKNDAERQRQQELLHLHKMNERLRAARTSIRDASRGMRRVENKVEHVEQAQDEKCEDFSLWREFKRQFYNPKLKPTWRRGLTLLSIALISFVVWYIVEDQMCELYCHKLYAPSQSGYGVITDAPRFPYVIPTMLYRTLLRPWCLPITSSLSWIWSSTYSSVFSVDNATGASTTTTAQRIATSSDEDLGNTYRYWP